MIRTQLGMSPGQLGPREPIQVPIIIRRFASPGTTQSVTAVVTPAGQLVPQQGGTVPVNVITPPAQPIVTLDDSASTAVIATPAVIPTPATDIGGTIIPGVADEYTYIGGAIILFLLFSSMKHRR